MTHQTPNRPIWYWDGLAPEYVVVTQDLHGKISAHQGPPAYSPVSGKWISTTRRDIANNVSHQDDNAANLAFWRPGVTPPRNWVRFVPNAQGFVFDTPRETSPERMKDQEPVVAPVQVPEPVVATPAPVITAAPVVAIPSPHMEQKVSQMKEPVQVVSPADRAAASVSNIARDDQQWPVMGFDRPINPLHLYHEAKQHSADNRIQVLAAVVSDLLSVVSFLQTTVPGPAQILLHKTIESAQQKLKTIQDP
jgi:hypothetical protein